MAITRRHPAFIVSLIGPGGAGKTWAGLTGPAPVHVISVDPNTQFVIDQVQTTTAKEIVLHDVELPKLAFQEDRDDVRQLAQQSWDDLIDAFRPLALDTKPADAGTVVLDTADEIYNVSFLAEFGKLDQIPPDVRKNMVGRANTRYKQMIMGLRDAGWVVVLLHRPAEVWVDAVERTASGPKDVRKRLEGPFAWERRGYKDTGTLVSVESVVAFDVTRGGEEAKLSAKYGMKYLKNTHRPILTGVEAWGREAPTAEARRMAVSSIPYIGMQSFPGTTAEDWR